MLHLRAGEQPPSSGHASVAICMKLWNRRARAVRGSGCRVGNASMYGPIATRACRPSSSACVRIGTFSRPADGISGLSLARVYLPDLILLDLQLPSMSDDLVLTELRAEPRTRHLPVLVLSADATVNSRERLLTLGANAYQSKPFIVAELLEKLDTMLAAARRQNPEHLRGR